MRTRGKRPEGAGAPPREQDGRRGSALLIVLLVVAIVGALGVGLSDLAAGDRLITRNREQAARALRVAQAGLAVAYDALASDAAWPGAADLPFGEGETMHIQVEAMGAAERRVTATGKVPGGERAVQARIDLGDPALPGDERIVPGSWRER
jgi:type II secretory pathway component PulK